MTDAARAIGSHDTPRPKRGGVGRALKLVGLLVVALGAALVVQTTTGIACGSSLPGIGQVTCSKPSGGDIKDFYDARTSYIVADRDFGRARTACEIGAMSSQSASDAAFGRCLTEQQQAFDEATIGVRRSAATMLEYLDPGACRTAVTRWDEAAASLQELAARLSSGSVRLSEGRLPARVVNAWNGAGKAERTAGDAVVAACD